MTGGERLLRKRLRRNGIGSFQREYAVLPHRLAQPLPTHRQRLVDEVDTVGMQDVEEPRPQDLGSRTRRLEAAQRLLERPRRAVLVERQRLAVEDERPAREARDDLDEFRHPRGDIGQGPAEHLDPTARPAMAVHLDPSAIELDLD